MGYDRIQKEWIPVDVGASAELLDLTVAASTALTWKPAMKCKIYGWGGMHMEAIVANGINTTAPVISMEYDSASASSVEKSAITAAALNTAYAVGTEVIDYVNPFYCDGEAGDAILFKIKTVANGATTAGEVRPFVLVEWFPACKGE